MADQLSDEQFQLVLQERDTFKLGIRGFTSIEADIDAAVLEAFTGDLPGKAGARQLGGFKTRLTLAVALGIVRKEHRPIIDALARFRNDLAHGKASELTPQRRRGLTHALRAVLPARAETDEIVNTLNSGNPRVALVFVLIAARAVVQTGARAARQRRAQMERDSVLTRAIRARLQELEQQVPSE